MPFEQGDYVEAQPASQRYRGERGHITGWKNGMVYVLLHGLRSPVPFWSEELRMIRSARYQREVVANVR
jgi:hypothetical protein